MAQAMSKSGFGDWLESALTGWLAAGATTSQELFGPPAGGIIYDLHAGAHLLFVLLVEAAQHISNISNISNTRRD
jgi:hypothetical protein